MGYQGEGVNYARGYAPITAIADGVHVGMCNGMIHHPEAAFISRGHDFSQRNIKAHMTLVCFVPLPTSGAQTTALAYLMQSRGERQR